MQTIRILIIPFWGFLIAVLRHSDDRIVDRLANIAVFEGLKCMKLHHFVSNFSQGSIHLYPPNRLMISDVKYALSAFLFSLLESVGYATDIIYIYYANKTELHPYIFKLCRTASTNRL